MSGKANNNTKFNVRTNQTLVDELRDTLPGSCGPAQLPQPLIFSEIRANRYLLCDHYDYCLMISASLGWSSFTCSECPLFILTLMEKPK